MDSRTFVKILCAQEALNYEKVAKILADKTGRHYTKASVNNKLYKDTLRYSEASALAEALGYDLIAVKKSK